MGLFGRLDVLVNSAGVYREGAIEDMTSEQLDEVLDINVKGTYYLCQAAVTALKESRGNIINVASDAGIHGNYYCAAYCASKGAVVLFTRSLALELAGFQVRSLARADRVADVQAGQIAHRQRPHGHAPLAGLNL